VLKNAGGAARELLSSGERLGVDSTPMEDWSPTKSMGQVSIMELDDDDLVNGLRARLTPGFFKLP